MKSKVGYYTDLAYSGKSTDLDKIMNDLTTQMTLAESKIIDYALNYIESDEGINRMKYYLFKGTQIQRNYCTLYFNRRCNWEIVKAAFDKGLIDSVQAFSR